MKRIVTIILTIMTILCAIQIQNITAFAAHEQIGDISRTSEISLVRTGSDKGAIRQNALAMDKIDITLYSKRILGMDWVADDVGARYSYMFEVAETGEYTLRNEITSNPMPLGLTSLVSSNGNCDYSFTVIRKGQGGGKGDEEIYLYEKNDISALNENADVPISLETGQTYLVKINVMGKVATTAPVNIKLNWKLGLTSKPESLERTPEYKLIPDYTDSTGTYYRLSEHPIEQSIYIKTYRGYWLTGMIPYEGINNYKAPKSGIYKSVTTCDEVSVYYPDGKEIKAGYANIRPWYMDNSERVLKLSNGKNVIGETEPLALTTGAQLYKNSQFSIQLWGEKSGTYELEGHFVNMRYYIHLSGTVFNNTYESENVTIKDDSGDVILAGAIVKPEANGELTVKLPDLDGNLTQEKTVNNYNYYNDYYTYEITENNETYLISYTDNSVTYSIINHETNNVTYNIYNITNNSNGSTDNVPYDPNTDPDPTDPEEPTDPTDPTDPNEPDTDDEDKGLLETIWDFIKDTITETIKSLVALVSRVIETIIKAVTAIMGGLWGIVDGLILGMIEKLADFFELFNWESSPLFDFFKGGDDFWIA